ncbi:MAG: hypothetical protein R2712_07375 [Vicinamibacterales bacterium]
MAEDAPCSASRATGGRGGGFHSAGDDGLPPGARAGDGARSREGAFYVWGLDEVRARLGESSRAFELRYGVLPGGNAPFDPQQEFDGLNILYTARSISDIARETSG